MAYEGDDSAEALELISVMTEILMELKKISFHLSDGFNYEVQNYDLED